VLPVSAPAPSFARLLLVFSMLGLTFSRVSLLAHEFLGHGAIAVGLGGTVTDFRLFLFAGGWIHYERSTPYSPTELALIAGGGVMVELVLAAVAAALAFRCRPGGLARLGLIAYAVANGAHAGYYAAVGVHHGLGDGAPLRVLLGPHARVAVVLAASLVAVASAFVGARAFFAHLWPHIGARPHPWRVTGSAMVLAACIHGVLAVSSLVLERDAAYASVMQSESERRADEEVARLRRIFDDAGRVVDARRLEAARSAVLARERQWPVRPLLVVALVLAVAAGARWRRALAGTARAWSTAEIASLVASCTLAIAAVAIVRAL